MICNNANRLKARFPQGFFGRLSVLSNPLCRLETLGVGDLKYMFMHLTTSLLYIVLPIILEPSVNTHTEVKQVSKWGGDVSRDAKEIVARR